MAMAKKNHRDPTNIGFFGSPRKKLNSIRLHKGYTRLQPLGRYCNYSVISMMFY
jgi:hypothetical protein